MTKEDWKKGNKNEYKNYIGITLLYKNLWKNDRKEKSGIQDQIREEQYGFQCGRSTIDTIFVLRQVTEKTLEYGLEIIIAFLYVKKACDTIDRDLIWKALQN